MLFFTVLADGDSWAVGLARAVTFIESLTSRSVIESDLVSSSYANIRFFHSAVGQKLLGPRCRKSIDQMAYGGEIDLYY